MTKVTEERLKDAVPILEKYIAELNEKKEMNLIAFEAELNELWHVNYQGLKPFICALSMKNKYKYIAAYYMEKRMVFEFHDAMVGVYGAKLRSDQYFENGKKFWDSIGVHIRGQVL